MGNYRQHLTTSTATGVLYAAAAHFWAGLHWLYASIAALLAAVAGLLPDLDHPGGVEIRGVTTLLGSLAALLVWRTIKFKDAELPVEAQIWAVLAVYAFFRFGSKRIFSKLMVHRGMSHSLPTAAAWTTATYLLYPSPYHPIRVVMATAVFLGFFSHLVLDEVFSVDLKGARVKKSFGTAMKFWAPSLFGTMGVYLALYGLVREAVRVWPDGPILARLADPVPPPNLPEVPPAWREGDRPRLAPPGRGARTGGSPPGRAGAPTPGLTYPRSRWGRMIGPMRRGTDAPARDRDRRRTDGPAHGPRRRPPPAFAPPYGDAPDDPPARRPARRARPRADLLDRGRPPRPRPGRQGPAARRRRRRDPGPGARRRRHARDARPARRPTSPTSWPRSTASPSPRASSCGCWPRSPCRRAASSAPTTWRSTGSSRTSCSSST